MNLMPITPDRKEIIEQFPIEDRDNHIYKSIEEAVEDALRRAFKDLNFRTMTANNKNNSIKKILEQLNGVKKVETFNINTITDQKEKKNIAVLRDKLKAKNLTYNDCKITEYLIIDLADKGFLQQFIDYFNSPFITNFDKWHHDTACMFLKVLTTYYKKAYYGKAQKIVNMMFKHLYCMNFGENQKGDKSDWIVLDRNYFIHCHMPLDSFTLDWLHRKDGEAVCEWSNLEYNSNKNQGKASTDYTKYLDRVKKQFSSNKGITAFEAEFYIWPQMQITQALETVYRMDHNKAAITTFVGSSVANKCSIMAFELGQRSFSKMFI